MCKVYHGPYLISKLEEQKKTTMTGRSPSRHSVLRIMEKDQNMRSKHNTRFDGHRAYRILHTHFTQLRGN